MTETGMNPQTAPAKTGRHSTLGKMPSAVKAERTVPLTKDAMNKMTGKLITRLETYLRARTLGQLLTPAPMTTFRRDAWELIELFADDLWARETWLTKAQAIDRVCQERPALHNVYVCGMRLGE